MATPAFQHNAYQASAFQVGLSPVTPAITTNAGDFIDYIFKFPDQGSFLRDQTIAGFGQPGVPLLIYNPVETNQQPVPAIGNNLVFPPQLANSSVALPGYWVMVTIKTVTGTLPTGLTLHPNIEVVNDRTLMFAAKPSVLLNNIDVSHINIVINIFGVYVRDGLQLVNAPASIPFVLIDFGMPILVQ